MTQMKSKSAIITDIRRARNVNNPDIPGNIRINEQWFSGREWGNNIVGAELPRELPVSAFVGSKISYKILDITQEMLDAGNGSHKETINGREIEYKKIGAHNVDLKIDWSTVNFSDNTVNMMKIKALFPTQTRVQTRPVVRTAAPSLIETLIEQPEDLEAGSEITTPEEELTDEQKTAKELASKTEKEINLQQA